MSIRTFAARRPEAATRLGVWLLGLGETIVWACLLYVFAALLLTWEMSLGWAKTDLTLGLTTAILAAAVTAPVAGRLIDAGHGRWTLGLGALAGALGLAALSTVTTPTGFVAVWAWIGVAQAGCLYEACFAVVTRARGEAARPAITRITLLGGFASSICFVTTAALTEWTDWRGVLLIFAAAAALIGAPALYAGAALLEGAAGDAAKPTPKAQNRAALKAALRRPTFWLIALAFPLMALNHGILLNHILPLLAERGLAKQAAIAVASTVGVMQVAGRVALMLLEGRTNPLAMAAIAFAGVTLSSLILLASGASAPLAFAFAALQGAAYGLTSILKPAITAQFLGRTGFGAIAGWLALPYLAAYALAPHLGALIWEAGGYALVVPMTAGLAALGAVCVAGLAAAGRR